MDSLLNWIPDAVTRRRSGRDPSRSTPEGSVLLFESHASLTGYENTDPEDPELEHSEVYRYEAGTESLACLSCNPTGIPAASDARLQSSLDHVSGPPLLGSAPVANLTEDGSRVFFESGDRLVSGDTDGLLDVYQWEAQGRGGCEAEEGCLSLLSSGQSAGADYLWAATPDGSDVFIRTAAGLLPQDPPGGAPSIYDARVGGGFPQPDPPVPPCLGEACQPAAVAPDDPTPASSGTVGRGNPPARRNCAAAARRAKRLSAAAKLLRRVAPRVKSAKQARRMRRKAGRLGKRAKPLSASARKCRRHNARILR